MSGAVHWGPSDRTGGPVDELFDELRLIYPDLRVERFTGTLPADDDHLWYVTRPGLGGDVQVETRVNGHLPFLLESDDDREEPGDVPTAVELLTGWLRS